MLRDGGGEHEAERGADMSAADDATPATALLRLLDERTREHAGDVGGLLHALGDYVSHSLAAEDARLRAVRFDGADEHLRAHAALRAIFADLVKAYARYGDDPRVPRHAYAKVHAWAEAHRALDALFAEHERRRTRAA
jgi:hemerythrin